MRLLLIQQQKPLVRALKHSLEEEGFAVDTALDGDEANSKATAASYDAIILDSMLPKANGLSLLSQWRRGGVDSHVVILTSRNTVEDKVQGLNMGADDYLTKPFRVEELLARLRAGMRRSRQLAASVVRVHDLEIDCATHTVKRGGRVIRLTPREFALLQFLAAHRGQVVTRSMIWKQFYDEHDADTSNVVDVYIRYLRIKIDKGFELPLILTRWGQGYMLRGDSDA